jgi:hypothetical protein
VGVACPSSADILPVAVLWLHQLSPCW